jgi:hypothetical protein
MKRISLLIFTLALTACEFSYFNSGTVGKAVRKELRELNKQELVLSDITKFKWDELFLFEPYTDYRSICKQLTISEKQCVAEIPEQSMADGEMYIVFRNNGIIVHKEMYLRFNGDFTPIKYKQPLTPDTAIFKVIHQGESASGKPWLKLELRSNKALNRN